MAFENAKRILRNSEARVATSATGIYDDNLVLLYWENIEAKFIDECVNYLNDSTQRVIYTDSGTGLITFYDTTFNQDLYHLHAYYSESDERFYRILMKSAATSAAYTQSGTKWRVLNGNTFQSGTSNLVLVIHNVNPTNIVALENESLAETITGGIYLLGGTELTGTWYNIRRESTFNSDTGLYDLRWYISRYNSKEYIFHGESSDRFQTINFFRHHMTSDGIVNFENNYYFDSATIGDYYYSTDGSNYTKKNNVAATGSIPSTAKRIVDDVTGRVIDYQQRPNRENGEIDIQVTIRFSKTMADTVDENVIGADGSARPVTVTVTRKYNQSSQEAVNSPDDAEGKVVSVTNTVNEDGTFDTVKSVTLYNEAKFSIRTLTRPNENENRLELSHMKATDINSLLERMWIDSEAKIYIMSTNATSFSDSATTESINFVTTSSATWGSIKDKIVRFYDQRLTVSPTSDSSGANENPIQINKDISYRYNRENNLYDATIILKAIKSRHLLTRFQNRTDETTIVFNIDDASPAERDKIMSNYYTDINGNIGYYPGDGVLTDNKWLVISPSKLTSTETTPEGWSAAVNSEGSNHTGTSGLSNAGYVNLESQQIGRTIRQQSFYDERDKNYNYIIEIIIQKKDEQLSKPGKSITLSNFRSAASGSLQVSGTLTFESYYNGKPLFVANTVSNFPNAKVYYADDKWIYNRNATSLNAHIFRNVEEAALPKQDEILYYNPHINKDNPNYPPERGWVPFVNRNYSDLEPHVLTVSLLNQTSLTFADSETADDQYSGNYTRATINSTDREFTNQEVYTTAINLSSSVPELTESEFDTIGVTRNAFIETQVTLEDGGTGYIWRFEEYNKNYFVSSGKKLTNRGVVYPNVYPVNKTDESDLGYAWTSTNTETSRTRLRYPWEYDWSGTIVENFIMDAFFLSADTNGVSKTAGSLTVNASPSTNDTISIWTDPNSTSEIIEETGLTRSELNTAAARFKSNTYGSGTKISFNPQRTTNGLYTYKAIITSKKGTSSSIKIGNKIHHFGEKYPLPPTTDPLADPSIFFVVPVRDQDANIDSTINYDHASDSWDWEIIEDDTTTNANQGYNDITGQSDNSLNYANNSIPMLTDGQWNKRRQLWYWKNVNWLPRHLLENDRQFAINNVVTSGGSETVSALTDAASDVVTWDSSAKEITINLPNNWRTIELRGDFANYTTGRGSNVDHVFRGVRLKIFRTISNVITWQYVDPTNTDDPSGTAYEAVAYNFAEELAVDGGGSSGTFGGDAELVAVTSTPPPLTVVTWSNSSSYEGTLKLKSSASDTGTGIAHATATAANAAVSLSGADNANFRHWMLTGEKNAQVNAFIGDDTESGDVTTLDHSGTYVNPWRAKTQAATGPSTLYGTGVSADSDDFYQNTGGVIVQGTYKYQRYYTIKYNVELNKNNSFNIVKEKNTFTVPTPKNLYAFGDTYIPNGQTYANIDQVDGYFYHGCTVNYTVQNNILKSFDCGPDGGSWLRYTNDKGMRVGPQINGNYNSSTSSGPTITYTGSQSPIGAHYGNSWNEVLGQLAQYSQHDVAFAHSTTASIFGEGVHNNVGTNASEEGSDANFTSGAVHTAAVKTPELFLWLMQMSRSRKECTYVTRKYFVVPPPQSEWSVPNTTQLPDGTSISDSSVSLTENLVRLSDNLYYVEKKWTKKNAWTSDVRDAVSPTDLNMTFQYWNAERGLPNFPGTSSAASFWSPKYSTMSAPSLSDSDEGTKFWRY
ncbi:MAG: hypothetical protein GOVbin4551_43 [Prokaryotic dsDNA virus sp.]|nr:MAG: hypothetical protein GOVbin4551_43 [Prokaryotic dsDNA virus sp.]|tara:strand:- start:2410 stop:7632 length:5223 start_codon:yes stop_codon:yes gene_type:complete